MYDSKKLVKGTSEDLKDWMFDGMMEVDEFWYWYENYGYEGGGWLVARKGEKWGTANLGHCSCYGPEEAISEMTLDYANFDQLKAMHSEEALKEIGFDQNPYFDFFDDIEL